MKAFNCHIIGKTPQCTSLQSNQSTMQLMDLNILISYKTKQKLLKTKMVFVILQYFDYDRFFFLTTRLKLTLLP